MNHRLSALLSMFAKEFSSDPIAAVRLARNYVSRKVFSTPQTLATLNAGEQTARPHLFAQNVLQAKLSEANSARYECELLSELQQEIEICIQQEFGKDNNYSRAYRAQEIFYWYPALRWMDQMSSIRSVADIGTAYGTLLVYAAKRYPEAKLVAVDPCNYMAKEIIEKYKVRKITADIERDTIDFSQRYDLIVFTEVLEHLNFYPDSTLKKLYALLSDDGYLIITTPDAVEWGRVTDHYPSLQAIPAYTGQTTTWFDGHIWQYTHSEAVSVMETAGLQIVDWAYSKGVAARHLCYLLRRV